MTVSCVIPTHRRPEFLRLAIGSVAGQTLKPDEIVVVSDVSDPEARLACVEAQRGIDIPIHYHEYSDEGGGASQSRNYGARRAEGKILGFLDDDDIWRPDYLRCAVERLHASHSQLVVTWLAEFLDDVVYDGASIAEDLPPSASAAMNPGATGSNVILPAHVFWEIGGYDVDLLVKNDTDFLYRFLQAGYKYAVVSERLVLQRRHRSGQLTQKSTKRAIGTEMYLMKHRSSLSREDIRTLRRSVHHIKSHSEPQFVARLYHTVRLGFYYTPIEMVQVARNRGLIARLRG
ncbi:glycosyltransferase family 2 protein [Rhodococcus sp. AD45-ID]|nr:putative glycosyl transferase [Rhodococcus sp. AD45]PSR41892.1 glycosyltransferase family 2 protein [Rhodococcus sp. AD45-ID]